MTDTATTKPEAQAAGHEGHARGPGPSRFALTPLTRKRWRQFRRNRRAWGALWALAVIFALSLCAELLCNERPLYLRFRGCHYFPFLRYYSQAQVLGNGVEARVDYGALRASAEFAADHDGLMVRAPVPYGPHQVVNPSAFEPHRRAVMTIAPSVAIGRLNLAADGRIGRALGCEAFFPGNANPDGLVFTNYWRFTPELAAALAARFANRAAPALTTTLTGLAPPTSPRSPDAPRPAARACVSVALAAYAPREAPPASVRLALRPPETRAVAPVTIGFQRRDGRPHAVARRAWRKLSPADRDCLLALAAEAFEKGASVGATLPLPTAAVPGGQEAPPRQVTCRLEAVSWPHRPVPGHWLGIDAAGRDVLARLLYGTRTALAFGLLLVGWAMLLGLIAGAVQGYFGGLLDLGAQRLIEIWSALPFLYVMILLGSVLGRSFGLLLLCYGLFNWIGISYYVRAEFLRLRHRPFVEAAHCQGLSPVRIMLRHMLPNAITPLITLMPFSLVGAIASITALDYLGFGLPPLTPSWGELLQQAQQARDAWWLILYPSLMLFTVMLLTVLIGEGLRDAFDPKPCTCYR
ncbi:MAG: ABC transporter permease subunit [Kiritimatiellae bacterium]|nr:ABC transporter permease subunit [Kiritimatiellia bacterium]